MEWLKLPEFILPVSIIGTWADDSELVYLDSSDETNPYSKHSILGVEPFLHIIYKEGTVQLIWRDGSRATASDVWKTIRELLSEFKIYQSLGGGLPSGAAIGYMSYDLGMELEGVKSSARYGFNWPLLELAFYDLLFSFDLKRETGFIISTGLPYKDANQQKKRANNRLKYALNKIENYIGGSTGQTETIADKSDVSALGLKSNFDRVSYYNAIESIKAYIEAGDVYQVNLSQSFSGKTLSDGWHIYNKIRAFNKVPFGGYLRFNNREVLSFSMERFLRMQGKSIETRPIKGTRPRGKDEKEDLRFMSDLFESRKDRAELLMIVDMERNDLGKVCRPGSVRVKRLFEVERYATVFHLVSTIRGELEDGVDQIDCIKACLPGGSITGAPKIRAMEIIDELEGIRREVYCGAIGYLGFNGVSDFNIPIRTIFKQDNEIRFNSGGGILYDSDPESEYNETIHKVKSFIEHLF